MKYPRIVGITPFESPDVRLAAALSRAGALAVIDLTAGGDAARDALAALRRDGAGRGFGVRLPAAGAIAPADLPANVDTVVLGRGAEIAAWRPRRVLVEVTSVAEATAAVAAGADALIVTGNESAGPVGEETTLVLLQRVIAAAPGVPLLARGGIGLHTAAAAIVAGAAGVVLDAQLALLAEAQTPQPLKQALAAMDGSETAVIGGKRRLQRPGAPDVVLGQDAAFAAPLAARFRTAANLVRGLGQAIASHLRQAAALSPLAPGARWARQHRLRVPIAQGPMTRVSDRAGFALAVAEAGGLPFLALSLMRAAEARPLLEETKARLGERTWGVGILGFVPPELREEQLALLAELRPPVVLIAGGRPAQAKPLEALGIPTYLHVPSPGLLDLFVKEGCRRFVLEGRECGGHVGPRSSFVLWESAIERLAADLHAGEMSVLFAGGIHDGRSAAMVAAAAAPLCGRGGRIGVLMGTAYLFTEEAVASGAIQPGFQAEAIACRDTVLLDTAPGHATRCAETDYVRAFRDERVRLEREGKDPREVWEALEQLNLGRLRIAAKGLRRDGAAGGALADVDDGEQRREGMYMMGQVAALRDRVVTVAELHADVAEGSVRVLAAAQPSRPEPAPGERAPRVAIIGMAGVFPGAPDLERFWANIVGGVDAVTEVPKRRWNADLYYDPNGAGEKTPSKWGGFLPEIPFDPAVYGIPPRSLAAVEPVQLLALEVSRRALADAGYLEREFDRERTSVIFGAEAGTDLSSAYGFRAQFRGFLGDAMPGELDAALPKLTEDSFPGILANVIAGRIANRLDLGGVNYTVDAACASSLAAVDLACKELAAGETDLVLCGGADLHNSIVDYLMFASVHALSASGRCKTFDSGADGIALGEGVAALVLKRVEDAERDGDRIYAVIEAVGGSSDGKSLGLTAPRKEGQTRALERAYRRAGVSPAEVELVEAHGTGTVVGDRTELATLTEIYGGAGAAPARVTLGSVKSNIGHTKCAAGLAGLIKVSLAIHRRVLPPTLHVKKPNPFWDAESSPFLFRERPAPWASARRRAGVSAFGFGGTNFHAVLAEHAGGEAPASGLGVWPCELVLIRGETREAAEALAKAVAQVAARTPAPGLAELALGTWRAGRGPVRLAVVAESVADLATKLGSGKGVLRDDVAAEVAAGKLALLFPGQGSQRPGMLDELLVAFPRAAGSLARAAALSPTIYPGAAFTPDGKQAQKAAITDTRVAQPALGVVDLAAARVLEAAGVRGELCAGHSYGELVALAWAGAFAGDDEALIALSAARAQAILDAAPPGAPGTMAAVKAGAEAVRAALGDGSGVVLANLNAADQTVIAGPDAAVDAAVEKLAAQKIAAKRIPVACAFHSPLVAGAAETLAARLGAMDVRAPDRPVFANTTAAPYPDDAAGVRALLARQVAEPVRFAEEIEAMYAAGARIFVEAGPGQVLGDLTRRILGARPHLAVSIDGGAGALAGLCAALARLATAGVAVDVEALHAGRTARAIDPLAPGALGPPPTAWLVDGQMARPQSGPLPEFAMRPLAEPVRLVATTAEPAAAPAGSSPQEALVLEYLRNMREIVAGQKEVLLRALGAPAAAAAVVQAIDVTATTTKATVAAVPAPALAAASAPVAAAPAAPSQSPLETLTAIVSERTGYPAEMLDPDLDLEADLGVDSIKRIEILGVLGERLGMDAGGEASRAEMIEELSQVKSLRGIARWVEAREGAAGAAAGAPAAEAASAADITADDADAVPAPIPAETTSPQPAAVPVRRFVLRREPLPPPVANGYRLERRRFLITDDGGGVAAELAKLLAAQGAACDVVAARPETPGALDGVIHLAPLAAAAGEDPRTSLFELARAAVDGGAAWLCAVTGQAGVPGTRPAHGGLTAMVKSVAREWPALRCRAIDVDPARPPAELAQLIVDELLADDPAVEVIYDASGRATRRPVEAEPEGEHAPPLQRGEVVLVTGGGRGITAMAAVALAERYGCVIELVGRSLLPGAEDPELSGCADAPALRRLLATRLPEPTPARIEATVQRVLADRQIRATLAALARAGVPHRYHAVDVRDAAAFAALIDDVYARHGRLDAVIHGAGVIEDKLLKHKTRESFDRVFATKVAGAEVLARKLRPGCKHVVFFSSVSGVFGNRGQVDYAAANEALDHLAHHLAGGGRRVVSIAWGPWGGTGMVSPELEREYARRGVGLIPPEEGVERLMEELARGKDAQVILMCASPESMD